MMSFLWPRLLLLLIAIPFLIILYFWILRRKRRFAIRYSSIALIREALPRWSRLRRHLPPVLYLLAITSLFMALTRPLAEIRVPLSQTSIVLALDISRSMCATDVIPNRLSVAQDAALAFIDEQAGETKIGLVAFADFAEIIVPPTNDKELLREAVSTLTTALGTAIGSATLKGIDAIAEVNSDVAPSAQNLGLVAGDQEEINQFLPDIIVLLTDGANTRGPIPEDAAQQAADRQLRVYTIGFGTTEVSDLVCTQAQMGGDSFEGGFGGGGFRGFGGGGGGGNFRRFLLLDEPTLRAVAEITGGTYYRAENASQLLEVFLDLPRQVGLQTQHTEISVAFAALGAVFVLLAVMLSVKWNRYP
jgi:Ca-activated chloride channel homolog